MIIASYKYIRCYDKETIDCILCLADGVLPIVVGLSLLPLVVQGGPCYE